MKILRLFLWDACHRRCERCCNQDWDLYNLPIINYHELHQFDQILLTGGEPMYYPIDTYYIIEKIREHAPKAKLYMYTAKIDDVPMARRMLDKLDGITVTLHDDEDVSVFEEFAMFLNLDSTAPNSDIWKSLRLNVFAGVPLPRPQACRGWKIKNDIEWIENCPLPPNEIFCQLQF